MSVEYLSLTQPYPNHLRMKVMLRNSEPTIHVKWRGIKAWSQPIKAQPGFAHRIGLVLHGGTVRLFWDGREQSHSALGRYSDVQGKEYPVFVGNDWREGMSIQ